MAEPFKVDSHVHLYRNREDAAEDKASYEIFEYGFKEDIHLSSLLGSVEEMLAAMRRARIDRAVILNLFVTGWERERFRKRAAKIISESELEVALLRFDQDVPEMLKNFNRWGCKVAQEHPEFLAFVSADLAAISGKDCAAHIRDLAENDGAKGVKLHGAAHGVAMGDRRLWPVYETCQELDIPIIGHSGPDAGGKGFAEPRAFADALEAFPQLRIVLAHLGGGSWRQALEIAERFSNAFFDCCEIIEWTGSENGPSDEQLAQLIKDIGPHRVMMGSDYPWYDLDHTVERVMELPVLSEEEKAGILGANAVRILGIA